ncbi:MAG: DUF547 domain-containing protein [Nitrospinae bacterium]|nr:DUF547 domain-containing protein [Nitrospinota bacterium]
MQNRSGKFKTIPRISAFAFAIVLAFTAPSSAGSFDFSIWDALLKKYVSPSARSGIHFNAVAYAQLKGDPRFAQLTGDLGKFSPDRLQTREERLAFWINAYNILAVKTVVDHFPVKSIKDAGNIVSSVWKRAAGVVGGKETTLHEIEHEILRKMGEPRIHSAIVCASLSCPDLRTEAFVPGKLNIQLDDQMKTFLENREKGLRVDARKGTVYLSSIFKWFAEDFETKGGVLAFVAQYAAPPDRKILTGGKSKIAYLDYDWSLNGP